MTTRASTDPQFVVPKTAALTGTLRDAFTNFFNGLRDKLTPQDPQHQPNLAPLFITFGLQAGAVASQISEEDFLSELRKEWNPENGTLPDCLDVTVAYAGKAISSAVGCLVGVLTYKPPSPLPPR